MYDIESWVATGDMLKVLEGLLHWAYRQIRDMTATFGAGREWEYPPVVAAMEDSGLRPIREYIRRRQATLEDKFYYLPIYELCADA